jgi:hypothetical protein
VCSWLLVVQVVTRRTCQLEVTLKSNAVILKLESKWYVEWSGLEIGALARGARFLIAAASKNGTTPCLRAFARCLATSQIFQDSVQFSDSWVSELGGQVIATSLQVGIPPGGVIFRDRF